MNCGSHVGELAGVLAVIFGFAAASGALVLGFAWFARKLETK